MKKLHIFANKEFQREVYVISRKNPSFSYFQYEYRNLVKDREGDIIFPADSPKEDGVVLSSIKKLFEERETISIPKSSKVYGYFETECGRNISLDSNQNIIVPGNSYQKKKR